MTIAEDPGPWGEGIIVEKSKLYRTLDFILERAVQNHKLHQDWNEDAGEFRACGRGDCTEVRDLLNGWGLGL